MTSGLKLQARVSEPTFTALLEEVKGDRRECGNFEEAFQRLLRKHNISAGETGEVLHCALHLKLIGYTRKSCIPYSLENFAEFVRVLCHYDLSFEEAMVTCLRQFGIKDFSLRSTALFEDVGKILGRRRKRRVA